MKEYYKRKISEHQAIELAAKNSNKSSNMMLKTVEDYYSYMSQANSFAPQFSELSKHVKEIWIKGYEEELSKARAIKVGNDELASKAKQSIEHYQELLKQQ